MSYIERELEQYRERELLKVYASIESERLAPLAREWLMPIYGEDAWKQICDKLDYPYRQRSVSKALVSICFYHTEKTPSFWMYPSGNYHCYGCQSHGDIADFIFRPITARDLTIIPTHLLDLFGSPPDELREADPIFEALRPRPTLGQLALWTDYELGIERF